MRLQGMALMGIIGSLTACGAKPTDPGQCSLQCSKAIIGTNDSGYQIRPFVASLGVSCFNFKDELPVKLEFLAFLQRDDIVTRPATDSANTGGGTSSGGTSLNGRGFGANLADTDANSVPVGTYEQPVPYLSFGTNLAKGIVDTPTDSFCSDSCGVMTLDFHLTCPPNSKQAVQTVYVRSGPRSSSAVDVTVSNLTE